MCLGIHLIPVRDVLIILLSQSKLFNFRKQDPTNNRQRVKDQISSKNILRFSRVIFFFHLSAGKLRELNFRHGLYLQFHCLSIVA